MYDDVLVPTDASPEISVALDHAFELARTYESTVHALYVADDSIGDTGLMGYDDRDPLSSLRNEGTEAVETIQERGREADVTVETAVVKHIPHRGITTYADENDIDLIVMSSRGHSGVKRFLFGSVTEQVLRRSNQPVLVVGRSQSSELSPETGTEAPDAEE